MRTTINMPICHYSTWLGLGCVQTVLVLAPSMPAPAELMQTRERGSRAVDLQRCALFSSRVRVKVSGRFSVMNPHV